jgi:hypothetical protein
MKAVILAGAWENPYHGGNLPQIWTHDGDRAQADL